LGKSGIFSLFSLAEYLMCAPDYYHSPNLQKLCATFGMEEYVLFPLSIEQQQPKILLLVGNTSDNAQYHSRVEPEGDFILGLANLVSQASIAIKQCQLYKQVHSKAYELEETINKLSNAQSHLIQTEKMSSLGQLVAGIAHEINNPVNFIFGNLIYASEYTKDVLSLLHLYQRKYPQYDEEIQAETEEIDLSFIEEDLERLLQSMHMGASRIRDIVISLRNFSRLDESNLKQVDIHSGIDSTLMILQNRFKVQAGYPVIQVVKEYDCLPLVECYAGQLNQVFMNILNNAIDALEKAIEKGEMKHKVPTIRVYTQGIFDQNGEADRVVIRIVDNGVGMSPEVQRKVFDPFFTTKPVGKGTGLAMSISFQVVTERHGGFLKCSSSVGEGTEFTLEIPCKQNFI
ncbi:MAG: ATP-binding protein, partial [Spirulinaceae cyanobacterium]